MGEVDGILASDARTGRRGWIVSTIGLAGLLGAALACQQGAEQTSSVASGESGLGQVLYSTYCFSCHGDGARGDGPAAPFLRTPPADLTELWKQYGTPLDRGRLAEYIDGRPMASAHGREEMPVWGEEFFADAPPLAPDTVERSKDHLVDALIRHLETLQTERAL